MSEPVQRPIRIALLEERWGEGPGPAVVDRTFAADMPQTKDAWPSLVVSASDQARARLEKGRR